MSGAEVQGIFVWHEWMGRDPSAVGAFYGRVFGWKAQAWEHDPSYTVWAASRGPAGGAARLAADAQSSGVPSGWLAYVAVTDVEGTAAAAERLGGRVVKSVAALPDGGRYAVVADPQSAVIGIFTPPGSGAGAGTGGGGRTGASVGGDATAGAGPGASEFVWHELGTTGDPAAAFRFYQELFGWERLGDHDLGAMGTYLIFGRRGRQLGGLYSRPPGTVGAPPPRWLAYVEVPNATQAAQAAVAAGGRVTNGPHQVPDGSWIAQLTDSEGAAIAVHQAHIATAAAPRSVPSRPAAVKKPAAATKPAAAAQPVAVAKKPAGASRKRRAAKKAATKRGAGRARTAPRAAARRSAAKPAARRKAAKGPARRAAASTGARRKAAKRPTRRAAARASGKRVSAARTGRKAAARRPARKTVRRKSTARRKR